ncbi:MAG: tryptophan--tRNA ligase, partial [Bacteroidota bacterium]
LPAIELSKNSKNESFFFIAVLHSLTTIKDARERIQNINATAAAWLSCGFDTEKNVFYRQSHVPACAELAWHLSCFTPYPMLANAHSFKDKSDRLADVNAGLFTYPVLMAADILLYDADFVPVGKDQKQHLEMTRDIANSVNHQFPEAFVVPEAIVDEKVQTIPGTDGQKMSKSYGNTIDVFLPEKKLRKNVMQIVTDSTPLEEPKDPATCNVFALYELLASESEITEMKANYQNGGFGYGQAKPALFEVILKKFKNEREKFFYYEENPEHLEKELSTGEKKAAGVADEVLQRVREKLGYK